MNILKELEFKSGEILKYFRLQLSGIRGGRPTAKLVENIAIDYLGQKLKIIQLGSISIQPPNEIQILVWDPGAASTIAKSIEMALQVKASTENNLVRVSSPPLTEERRLELIKVLKKEAEEARIKLRSLRDEVLKRLKKEEGGGNISEDEKFKLKAKIEESVKTISEEIEKLMEGKIAEINQ